MAYRTNRLGKILDQIDDTMLSIRGYCQTFRSRSETQSVSSGAILDLYSRLRTDVVTMASLAATPGLGNYARNEKNDANYDHVAEYNATVNLINNVTIWIGQNFPKDAGNFLLAETLGADSPVERQFSTASLVDLRTRLSAVIDFITG